MQTKTALRKTSPKKVGPKKAPPDPTYQNLDIYGSRRIPRSRALEQLEASASGAFWMATTNPDGGPHIAAAGALWIDGKIYFTTGSGTRKGRNLAANPNCAFSVSLTGIDLVLEGRAVHVTDRPALLRLARRYAGQGWPASVRGDSLTAKYSALSAGPPPWNLYVVTPTTAYGVATAEPSGATR